MKDERRKWLDRFAGVEPSRLVFIDETWAKTNMTRMRGRAKKHERLIDNTPHGHWKTTTFLAALRHDSLIAPLVVDGAINGEIFTAWLKQELAPSLNSGDIVVMDNLSSHKSFAVREIIEGVGAEVMYLPPYSPDFNPIEMVFSKVKSLLRKWSERNIQSLWQRLGEVLDYFPPEECRNYFRHCGY